MRIVKLTSETTKNILENMLKRSPSQYGEYEKRVQDIIANVKEKKDEAVSFLPQRRRHERRRRGMQNKRWRRIARC